MSIANVKQFKCEYCGDEAKGRTDQKFCSTDCRNGFHNQRTASNRKLEKLVNKRAIAYSKNVQLLNQLILDGRLGPHTHDELVAFGYCPDSPCDKQVNAYASQVTFYGNVRLKQSLRTKRYVLSIERMEKEEGPRKQIQRNRPFRSSE
jgi:hypothetical protein